MNRFLNSLSLAWQFLRKLNIDLPHDPVTPLGYTLKSTENKFLKIYLYSNVHSSIFQNSQEAEAS